MLHGNDSTVKFANFFFFFLKILRQYTKIKIKFSILAFCKSSQVKTQTFYLFIFSSLNGGIWGVFRTNRLYVVKQ